jgi:hypothetical protein
MKIYPSTQLDMSENYIEARTAYESDFAQAPKDPNLLIDMIMFYWELYDEGVATYLNLSRSEQDSFYDRVMDLIEYGRTHFFDNVPFQFWSEYVSGYEAGDFLSRERCLEFRAAAPDFIDPEFVILQTDLPRYATIKTAVDQHIAFCKRYPTARNRYAGGQLENERWDFYGVKRGGPLPGA